MAKRKYPPSYYRYRETHPAISVRLTKSLKEALDAYRGDLSYARAIRKLLEEKEEVIKLRAEIEKAKKKAEEEGYLKGFSAALHMFMNEPYMFYERLMKEASKQNLKNFEPALFTAPCSICGKPMVFTHKESNWQKEIKPRLRETFASWCHTACKKKKG
jgi:hypothetical protein